jgi:2-dehydropantoate 2-reductase
VAQVFATIAAPGVVHHVQLGRLILGELDGRESPRVRAILAACQRAGIPAEASPDIRRTLWEKYVFILAQAGATALTRCPVGVIRAVPETRRLFRLLAEETVALARASGVPVAPGFLDTVLGFLDAQRPGAFSSLHHDLVQGRRLELEALHGHAARLAERLGVPAPTITLVHAALRPYQDGPPAVPGG